jgi:NAD(P)-dependent dehydrogenase (short-subunit alcohol dehydrogenase family)
VTLQGKKALVTGANQGLGFAIAAAYAAAGADVAICARDAALLQSAAAALRDAHPAVDVAAEVCDVGDRAAVDALFAALDVRFGGLDIVVCNAGVYGPKGSIDVVDWESWVDAVQINLVGTVYCARRGLASLARSARGKIIIISGGGATKPLPNLSAYAASKAGIVRFGETLAEETRGRGIDVNMIAPGALNTRLLDEILAAGPQVVGEAFYAASLKQQQTGGTPLAVAARLAVFLASGASDGISGKLISAPWDPWERFSAADERLSGDVYTLRRIVPEERGWSW